MGISIVRNSTLEALDVILTSRVPLKHLASALNKQVNPQVQHKVHHHNRTNVVRPSLASALNKQVNPQVQHTVHHHDRAAVVRQSKQM